jgi:hypothetical protein
MWLPPPPPASCWPRRGCWQPNEDTSKSKAATSQAFWKTTTSLFGAGNVAPAAKGAFEQLEGGALRELGAF